MTYTQFVSTMNHMYVEKGPSYIVEHAREWCDTSFITREELAYSAGLIEYCCGISGLEFPLGFERLSRYRLSYRRYPEAVKEMGKILGKGYLEECWSNAIPEFKKHNVCVMEVGNAV